MRAAPDRVLATLNADGSRRWLRPKLSEGKFWHRRRAVAYVLMLVFFIIPYLRLNEKPLVLLDLPRREFTILGTTFLPTDTLLFMLLFVIAGSAIFLVTALLGRVWCGWSCPQTVYMEFLFRPIERWIEGGRTGTLALDRQGGFQPKRLFKFIVFLGLALFLTHTFLAYFVGIEQLAHWVQSSPGEHPTAFLLMAGTTAAILFNFGYFREQTCLVACPYGRLQSVLLDRQSLIVGYDPRRGEPRGKDAQGDCIDCHACVMTCPTGIDIRDGLQMECIHCTQCADACDDIMDKVGTPRGLIRYTSRDELEDQPRKRLRPRVILYPAALTIATGAFLFLLATRRDTDITILRGIGAPYSLDGDGRVVNQVRVRLTNRRPMTRTYRIELIGTEGAEAIIPENPMPVAGGEIRSTSLFIIGPPTLFHDGERHIELKVSDGAGYSETRPYTLIGPEGDGTKRKDSR